MDVNSFKPAVFTEDEIAAIFAEALLAELTAADTEDNTLVEDTENTMEVDKGLFAYFQEMQHVADDHATDFEDLKTLNALELTASISYFMSKANDAVYTGDTEDAREQAAAVGVIAAIYAAKFGALLG